MKTAASNQQIGTATFIQQLQQFVVWLGIQQDQDELPCPSSIRARIERLLQHAPPETELTPASNAYVIHSALFFAWTTIHDWSAAVGSVGSEWAPWCRVLPQYEKGDRLAAVVLGTDIYIRVLEAWTQPLSAELGRILFLIHPDLLQPVVDSLCCHRRRWF
eukprot:SAG31_NODE_22071_length_534_cov_1.278161_1_plen_160_part_01